MERDLTPAKRRVNAFGLDEDQPRGVPSPNAVKVKRPAVKRRGFEISDDSGFRESFPSLNQAAKKCGISSPSVLKYVLDQGKSRMTRRSDKKVFHVREVPARGS